MNVVKVKENVSKRIEEIEKDLRNRLYDIDQNQLLEPRTVMKQEVIYYPSLQIKFLMDLLILNREILKLFA